jgi:Tol biopolymer transport system component
MATGKKAFSWASQASLITAIMSGDPPSISSVQPMSPAALDRVVKTCLAKDPEDRWQSAGDVAKELKWIGEGSAAGIAAPAAVVSRRRGRERIAWTGFAIAAALAAALAAMLSKQRIAPGPVIRASILPPGGAEFVSTSLDAGPVEISPDGTRIAFSARQGEGPNMLWVRRLSESSAKLLAGTEGAERPFWSPDGRFIGFFSNRALRKIDANGGPVFTLAPARECRGGTWSRAGVILYTPDARGPVLRVSANGGKTSVATVYGERDSTHRYASFLPDGRHFLYLVRHSGAGSGQNPEVRVGSLDSRDSKVVLNVASNAVYASGRLLYVREGALVAQEFDLESLAVRGEPQVLAPDVLMDERFSRGVFSASDDGVLVYETGTGQTTGQLRWIDREGRILGSVGEPAEFFNGGEPEISPDGTRALASIVDLRTGVADIWMIDLSSGTRSRFTTGTGDKFWAVWSPDGRRIAFNTSNPGGGGYDIMVKSASGSTEAEKVFSDSVEFEAPESFSPDGRLLLFQSRKKGNDDMLVLPLEGERTPRQAVATPASEWSGQFSPNGRYVAYASDETGRFEIYVSAFPGPGGRWQVSQNGGKEPRWAKDGRELFFFDPENRLMAAEVRTEGGTFEVGAIHPLFQSRSMGSAFRYDVSRDGKKFLVTRGLPRELSPITLVTNWPEALRER